ncbi:MAG: AAA family ATPase [archaeon]
MKNIIAVTGMAGAGKGITTDVAQSFGYPVFVCGDVVREEARKRGIPETPENLGAVMLRIRREDGPPVVAKRLISRIIESSSQLVVVEGVRSLEEVNELRRSFGNITVVSIHASPSTRFERITERGRPDDPKSWSEFEERDMRELEVGIGKVIALADEMIVNEGNVDELEVRYRRVLEEILHVESDFNMC